METLRGSKYRDNGGCHFRDGQSGTLYIRMELLTSLQSYVRSRPFLTVPEIICIGLDVCRALAFCEEKHIIHRDIKPANIFIDEFGAYKVGDFGVSRRSETVHAAQPMTGIGTISYMAPEIYYGKPTTTPWISMPRTCALPAPEQRAHALHAGLSDRMYHCGYRLFQL